MLPCTPTSTLFPYTTLFRSLSIARRLITRHIAQPQLSPAFVANLLGISIRHLHVLFEEASLSFAQTVTALRIERSCQLDRKSTRLNSSHTVISYAVFCLKKK